MQLFKCLSIIGVLVLSTSVLAHPQQGRTRIDVVMAAPLVAQYSPPGRHLKHQHYRMGDHKVHQRWPDQARKERRLKRKIRYLRHQLARERARNAYRAGSYFAPHPGGRPGSYGSGLNLQYYGGAGYQLRYRNN